MKCWGKGLKKRYKQRDAKGRVQAFRISGACTLLFCVSKRDDYFAYSFTSSIITSTLLSMPSTVICSYGP